MTGLALLVTQTGPTIQLSGKGTSHVRADPALLTLMSLLPGALLMLTGFTRILIVLGFLRNALGTPTSRRTRC